MQQDAINCQAVTDTEPRTLPRALCSRPPGTSPAAWGARLGLGLGLDVYCGIACRCISIHGLTFCCRPSGATCKRTCGSVWNQLGLGLGADSEYIVQDRPLTNPNSNQPHRTLTSAAPPKPYSPDPETKLLRPKPSLGHGRKVPNMRSSGLHPSLPYRGSCSCCEVKDHTSPGPRTLTLIWSRSMAS